MTAQSSPWDDFASKPTERSPRALETRESSQRARSWVEPTMLPDPHPQDGYVFKWARTDSRGQADKINYQKRIREGWEPVNAEDHPELMMQIGHDGHGRVEVGGLILCKMPEEMVAQRREHYRRRTAAEMESADQQYLRDSDERMRKFAEKQRQTVFGR